MSELNTSNQLTQNNLQPQGELVAQVKMGELLQDVAADDFSHRARSFRDLLTVPMSVYRQDGKDGVTSYEIVMDREPFSAREFIDLYNTAASHATRQSAGMIGGDWVYGQPDHAYTDLALQHSQIPVWPEFVQRAESYVDLSRAAVDGFRYSVGNRAAFERWVASLPEPLTLEEFVARKYRAAQATTSQQLRAASDSFGSNQPEGRQNVDIQAYATMPAEMMVRRLKAAGYTAVAEALCDVVTAVYPTTNQKLQPREVLRRFARRPFKERVVVQQQLLAVLTGEERALPEDSTQHTIPSPKALRIGGIIACIGWDGASCYAQDSGSGARDGGIPADYRDITTSFIEEIDEHGFNTRDSKVIRTNRITDGKVYTENIRFYNENTLRKLKISEAIPLMRWTVVNGRRQWDSSFEITRIEADIPTTRYIDGLFGLVVVHFLSGDIVLPTHRGLRGVKKPQAMGAAQMPLLALMYRPKIVNNSSLLSAAEQL